MTMSVGKTPVFSSAETHADKNDRGFERLGIGSWLRTRALDTPQEIAFRYLKKNGSEVSEHRFGEVDLEARRLASWLREHGRPGDRVLLTHGPGPEFVAAFFACQYAGFIAVPAYPPRRTRHGNRVTAMLEDADCHLALADAVGRAAMEVARRDEAAWSGVQWPTPEDLTLPAAEGEELNRPEMDDVAFLQYTSGSTGSPKGVMVTHANLKHNVDLQRTASGLEAGSLMVSWVPFFHDFGLIHGLLCPLACGGSGVYLAPNDFMQEPELWLRTISIYRASHACAPNFAYDLCVRSITVEQREELDLSHWRYCVNGSEPVRASSIRGFEKAFADSGVRSGLIQPAYGLAENTLYVSSGNPLEKLMEIKKEEQSGAVGRSLVVCGRAPGQTVEIVDPMDGRRCEDGQVGEIWIQGASVAKGYWRKTKATEETFGGRLYGQSGTFLRTGDLGFKHGGHLVVSGRLKDLIILRGMNHYPQDLEATAQSVSRELATGAAFSVDGLEGESLVLVQETARHPKTPLSFLANEIIQAISQEHGVQVTELLLVPPNSVPRTSSGKVQRRACRTAYLSGGLKVSWAQPRGREAVEEPVSLEKRLAWIRATALQLGGVEPTDGFDAPLDAWSLDSLKIAELSARYHREFGQDLGALSKPDSPLRSLQGDALAPEKPVPDVRESPKSGAATMGQRWRCHAALESIWAFQQTESKSNAYHISWTAHLSGRPDPKQLEAGLHRLAQSQIALRSGFEVDEQSILWQVESQALAPLERPWISDGNLEQARQWAEGWNQIPFDLARPPLWKAAYLPLDDGGCLLAFAFHHIIFDQRSLEAFLESLDALVVYPESELEPQAGSPPQHREDASSLEDVRRYWRGHLKGLTQEGWLDHRQLAIPLAPKVLKAELPEETMAALRRLASTTRCTPFTVAALAWAEVLAGMSAAEDACFTVPFTLRDQPLSDRQIGYWVHPLPLRLKAVPNQDLHERLADASKILRAAMAHRQLSLAEAMRCVGLPVPAALLSYQGENRIPGTWLGSSAQMQPLPFSSCKAALLLEVSGESAWALSLEYHPLAVPEATAARCLQSFLNVCQRYAGQTPVSTVSLLKSERSVPIEHRTVVEAFHARVLLDAQAPALVFDKGTVDYGTLSSQVRSVARTLTLAGVKPGERVGVCSQASPAWVAAILGCFEASAVYVPLDPSYPPERLTIMLEDAACRLVLSDIQPPAWAGDHPWMDIDQALLAHPPYLREPGRPRPEDPAYVIFTSGSSGRPKGVQVSHAALMNNALGIGTRLNFTSRDRVMQFSSISFDPSLQDIFPTLVAGACVALPQRKGAPGPAEVASFIREHKVSLFFLPTAYWHAFMQAGGAEHLVGINSLRCAMAGGEAPAPRLAHEWNRVLPKVPFFNAYGPTETCIIVTLFECKAGDDMDAPIPLGQPLPGVELAVVDADGIALPAGEIGELWIAGDSLADGYLSPDGLERSLFSPASPDGKEPRAFYRTGDLSVMDDQGRIVYKGRKDRQIKAAGVRMDLEEIESILARAEGVAAAVVEAEGSGDSLQLRAWVAAEVGRKPSPQALREWLEKRLHHACVPAEIGVLKAFPVGPSGKIDRKALRNLPLDDAAYETNMAPTSPVVADQEPDLLGRLCAAFSEILNRVVGPEDDFFALGGTSLRAVRLAGVASRSLERNVLVDQIYQASTPRNLAGLLGGAIRPVSSGGILRPMAQGPGPAWILLPPVSGRLGCYRGLAGLLEGRAQVWGLDLSQLPAPEEGAWNAWVEACVRAIEASLPDQEVVLGGWSMGGLLAADIARMLGQRGRIVRRLLLIDAVLPDPVDSALILNDPAILDDLIKRDLEGGSHPPQGLEASSEEERRRYRQHIGASAGFALKPLEIPVSLVLSERTSREDARTGWMAWSLMSRAGMTCQLVPGDHFSVLSEGNLKRLSERLVSDVKGAQMEKLARI